MGVVKTPRVKLNFLNYLNRRDNPGNLKKNCNGTKTSDTDSDVNKPSAPIMTDVTQNFNTSNAPYTIKDQSFLFNVNTMNSQYMNPPRHAPVMTQILPQYCSTPGPTYQPLIQRASPPNSNPKPPWVDELFNG